MSDFYYTAGHSQCPGVFFGSIRVRDLQGTEIAFKLFLHAVVKEQAKGEVQKEHLSPIVLKPWGVSTLLYKKFF